MADSFREELAHAVAAVNDNPLTWPRYGRHARQYVFPRFPFSLVYRIRGDEIEIIAVAHGRRRALRAAADPGRSAARIDRGYDPVQPINWELISTEVERREGKR